MTGGIFLATLLIGVPISLVLMISAAAYIWLSGNQMLYGAFMQQLFSGIESYGLLAIPLFMLTGELMNAGGLTRRLIAMARVFVGGLSGGLAYINLVANMMMASIMGSAVAQMAVMSRVMVPEMEREGYDRAFAGALTAAGGLLSPIIPRRCCSSYSGCWRRSPSVTCSSPASFRASYSPAPSACAWPPWES